MSLKPFDVWMCTHNSQKLLPIVLPQISRVIPIINRKFIVDDFSTDNTKAVAKSLGWQVFDNKKRGLANARDYAFSLVETEYCASFEHDLYLANNWYPTIPNLVLSGKYDIAQGIRVRDVGGLREADIYDYNHRFVTSEDNTFYRMITKGLNQTPENLKYFVEKERYEDCQKIVETINILKNKEKNGKSRKQQPK